MRTLRTIGSFFILSTALFSLLIVAWPICGDTYGKLFRSLGNGVVGPDSQHHIWFSRSRGTDDSHDTDLTIEDPGSKSGYRVNLSSRNHGYLPSIVVVALTLATPTSWRRRFLLTMWALAWVYAYILLKLLLLPLAYRSDCPRAMREVLRGIFWIIGSSACGWMIVPVAIWVILTAGSRDRRAGLLRPTSGPAQLAAARSRRAG